METTKSQTAAHQTSECAHENHDARMKRIMEAYHAVYEGLSDEKRAQLYLATTISQFATRCYQSAALNKRKPESLILSVGVFAAPMEVVANELSLRCGLKTDAELAEKITKILTYSVQKGWIGLPYYDETNENGEKFTVFVTAAGMLADMRRNVKQYRAMLESFKKKSK